MRHGHRQWKIVELYCAWGASRWQPRRKNVRVSPYVQWWPAGLAQEGNYDIHRMHITSYSRDDWTVSEVQHVLFVSIKMIKYAALKSVTINGESLICMHFTASCKQYTYSCRSLVSLCLIVVTTDGMSPALYQSTPSSSSLLTRDEPTLPRF